MSTVALREVRLYGQLGREFGRVFRLAVATPAEAVRALCAVLPGFERAFLGNDGQQAYHVFVGRKSLRRDLSEEEVTHPIGATDPIRLVPVIEGAKRSGGLQIVVGYVLYALGVVAYAYGYGALGQALISVGQTMILGGIIQLLSPQRTGGKKQNDNLPSYAFDGPVNNTEQGGPVPYAAGRVFIGSTVVSQGLSTDDLIAPPLPMPPNPGLPSYEPRTYEP